MDSFISLRKANSDSSPCINNSTKIFDFSVTQMTHMFFLSYRHNISSMKKTVRLIVTFSQLCDGTLEIVATNCQLLVLTQA